MIYSLILRNQSFIADYSECEGDFQEVSMRVIKSIVKNERKQKDKALVVNYEDFDINIMNDNNTIFLCITKTNSNHLKILEYLETLKERFKDLNHFDKNRLCLSSTNLIKELMDIYKDNLNYEKFDMIEKDLDDMRVEIKNNIDKTLEKDFLLDSLNQKSENLSKASNNIKFKARKKVKDVEKSQTNFFCMILLISIIILASMYQMIFNSNKKDDNLSEILTKKVN